MTSSLDGSAQTLAVRILRCPILDACLEDDGYRLACYDVAVEKGGPHQARWVPEPWVGHLTKAPLLFLSSNPGGGGDPITDPEDVSVTSTDQQLLACLDGGFDPGQRPGIVEGIRWADRKGTVGKAVRYWVWTLASAHELLLRPPSPGHDYALTEVVHCGSLNEQGA